MTERESFTYDEIVAALRGVVEHLWEECQEARNVCNHYRDDLQFEDFPERQEFEPLDELFGHVRLLKRLLNLSEASRNAFEHRGHCPNCGGNDGRFNIDRDWFCYCELCRCMWKLDRERTLGWPGEPWGTQHANRNRFTPWPLVEPVRDWSKRQEVQL